MEQRSLYLIRQAVNAVFKRRAMVGILFLIIFIPLNLGSLLREPVYRSVGKILVSHRRVQPEVSPLQRQASADRPPNEAVINSEIQILKSRDLLALVSDALEKRRDSEGADWSVPSVASLEGRLSVVRKPGSNVIQVTYRSADEEQAVDVINTLFAEYLPYSVGLQSSPRALRFFGDETDAARDAYRAADVALERYDAAHGLTSIAVEKDQLLRQRSQLEADLRRSEAEITELATKVAALEAELDYIPEHEATEVDMIPNPMLGYLRQQLAKLEMERARLLGLYTPQHRTVMDVETEIATLKRQVVAQETSIIGRKKMAMTSVRRGIEQGLLDSQAELGALEARRALLSERIAEYDGRIRVMHAKHYQVMRLRRDRTEKKVMYDALVQKYGQLRVNAAMDDAGLSNVAIVQAAAGPLRREPDFKMVTLILSLFAGLLIGVGSAIATEMMNPVMNSEIDIRHHLGLPVLAEISLNGMDAGNGHLHPPGGARKADIG